MTGVETSEQLALMSSSSAWSDGKSSAREPRPDRSIYQSGVKQS
jgi:hypothetical protein